MESKDKCRLLAGEIQKILSDGLTLSNDVVHYIDSTFSNPTPEDLQSILQDDADCEKDSLMELLLFPDEFMQLRLEELLEHLQFVADEEKSVPARLLRAPLQITVHFPEGRGSLTLEPAEDVVCRFVSRLNITKHLHPRLLEALNRYDDKTSKRIKVKIRNSRFSPTDGKIDFLGLFFEKFDSRDNDIFACLDFLLGFLDEHRQIDNIYQALTAKKKFYFISLQKAGQLEAQLRKHNIEILRAQGKRILLIDSKDAREKMRIIDRISRAIFEKTEYFEPLENGAAVRNRFGQKYTGNH